MKKQKKRKKRVYRVLYYGFAKHLPASYAMGWYCVENQAFFM